MCRLHIPGFPVDQTGQGAVQTEHHQLLGPDVSQPDPEHYHVQVGQAQEGRVWATTWQESCKCFLLWCILRPKKINLVLRATVLKFLGRVGSFFVCFFLRMETSIIKTQTKKNSIFVKKSLGSAGSDR